MWVFIVGAGGDLFLESVCKLMGVGDWGLKGKKAKNSEREYNRM